MTPSLHRCPINHRGKVLGSEPVWDYDVQISASSSQTKTKTHIWKDSVAFPFLTAIWFLFTIRTPTTPTDLSIISSADILGLKEVKENVRGTYLDSFLPLKLSHESKRSSWLNYQNGFMLDISWGFFSSKQLSTSYEAAWCHFVSDMLLNFPSQEFSVFHFWFWMFLTVPNDKLPYSDLLNL